MSPSGRLAVDFHLDADGAPHYQIQLDGRPELQESRLGLVREDADFSQGLRFISESPSARVADDYEILTAKRRQNTTERIARSFICKPPAGKKLDVIFQVSDDGVAFRYVLPDKSSQMHAITEEVSSFHFPPGTKAWLQPMAIAKSRLGISRIHPTRSITNKEIPVGTPSLLGVGWVFPALFRSGDTWLLVSETGLGRNYCGSRLRQRIAAWRILHRLCRS